MGLFNRLKPSSGTTDGTPEVAHSSADRVPSLNEKTFIDGENSKEIRAVPSEDSDHDDEYVHTDMQRGIQKMEALAQVWPEWALFVTYAL